MWIFHALAQYLSCFWRFFLKAAYMEVYFLFYFSRGIYLYIPYDEYTCFGPQGTTHTRQ